MAKRKPLEHYLKLQYPFRADADPDGGFVVSFPDLPGCLTQVESMHEIARAAEEARQLWIETEYGDGEAIPEPSYPEEYSGKFNVRLPKSLHRRLVEAAEREGVSLNQHVVALLARGGDVRGGAEKGLDYAARGLRVVAVRDAPAPGARTGKAGSSARRRR